MFFGSWGSDPALDGQLTPDLIVFNSCFHCLPKWCHFKIEQLAICEVGFAENAPMPTSTVPEGALDFRAGASGLGARHGMCGGCSSRVLPQQRRPSFSA